MVATLDTGSKIVLDGHTYDKAIRASDCEILSDGRCTMCRRYRAHLRVKRYRKKPDEEVATKIAHDSHTPYANLPREDLAGKHSKDYASLVC